MDDKNEPRIVTLVRAINEHGPVTAPELETLTGIRRSHIDITLERADVDIEVRVGYSAARGRTMKMYMSGARAAEWDAEHPDLEADASLLPSVAEDDFLCPGYDKHLAMVEVVDGLLGDIEHFEPYVSVDAAIEIVTRLANEGGADGVYLISVIGKAERPAAVYSGIGDRPVKTLFCEA